ARRRAAERVPGAGRAGDRGDAAVRRQAGHATDQESRSGLAHPVFRVNDMDISIYSAFLPQDDPEKAKAFYGGTLGFEIRNDVGYNDMNWMPVGPPAQPGT